MRADGGEDREFRLARQLLDKEARQEAGPRVHPRNIGRQDQNAFERARFNHNNHLFQNGTFSFTGDISGVAIADFELGRFAHVAVWNAQQRRIEMHLESLAEQRVRIQDWTVAFARGERIWTESSYKYEPAEIETMGNAAGFTTAEQWIDGRARFALTLLEVGS